MRSYIKSVLFCALLLATLSVKAQSLEECELVLNKATEEFNAGHFYAIPAMLNDCLNKNDKPAWRQRAFALLAETYLLLDDPFGAERSYLEILRANPEFVADKDRDPIDLVYLGSKFTATPIFSLYGHLGGNVSPINMIVQRTTFAGNSSSIYKLRFGIQAGAGVEFHYDENISLVLEGNYAYTSYQYEKNSVFTNDQFVMTDKQNWLKLPFILKFTDAVGKYRPYGYVGYSFDVLFIDRATMKYTDRNISEGKVISDPRESPILNFQPKRNALNRSFIIGGGVKYKLGLDYAFVDLRYSLGLTNVANITNTIVSTDPEDPAFTWGHVDNLFRMNNLSISVGYVHPLYKPRKLKRARSRSVLQMIKKQGNEVTED